MLDKFYNGVTIRGKLGFPRVKRRAKATKRNGMVRERDKRAVPWICARRVLQRATARRKAQGAREPQATKRNEHLKCSEGTISSKPRVLDITSTYSHCLGRPVKTFFMRINLNVLDKVHKTLTLEVMTLLNVRNQIVGAFCEKDTFSRDDFAAVKLPKELEPQRKELIEAALGQLVKTELVEPAGPGLWILSSPLNAAGQDVHLSMPLCNEIAEIVNTHLESKGVEDRIDALNIHEGHIIALISIIGEILGNEEEA